MVARDIILGIRNLTCKYFCYRKEAVPLVDAFDNRDELLCSVLGRYDGDVYNHLYQWALKCPRNTSEVIIYYYYYYIIFAYIPSLGTPSLPSASKETP